MPSSHKPLHRCKENGQYVCGSSGLTKEMAIFQGVPNFSKYTHYCIHPCTSTVLCFSLQLSNCHWKCWGKPNHFTVQLYCEFTRVDPEQ